MAKMTGLNDFLSVISAGKEDYKKNDPVGKHLEIVKENVKEDVSLLFSELASMAHLSVITQEPLDAEIRSVLSETLTELYVEEPEPIVEVAPPLPEIKPASQQYTPQEIKKLDNGASFQQPNPDLVNKNIDDIRNKIKFMEQAISKIAATGPGSGEVNLRYLDDIDRTTIANDRYLKYDQYTKKFVFANPNAAELGVLDYIQLNTLGPGEVPLPGTLSWNPNEDCLDVTQNDGSTLQVGLENYIEVHNHTGIPMTNGSVVRFGGVDPTIDGLPLCVLMNADFTANPLYIIGVLTNDIPNGSTGRATILGRVHSLNTTGSDVGETWNVGDLLWVHPTTPGKLTKIKPTVPQMAISVAAVVHVGSTDGTLLVRPTIWPRLLYGTFLNTLQHTPTSINTAMPIDLDTTTIANGFSISSNSHIVTEESGLYNFNTSIQLSSTNSSAKNIYFWVRKNGVDIPHSTRSITVNGNNTQSTFSCNWTISMDANQYVQLMWATTELTIRLDAPAATSFAPSTPSVLLTVTQTAL